MDFLNSIFDAKFSRIKLNINKPIKVGTDCSGIDAPIQALKVLGLPISYEFGSDIDPNSKKSINCNHPPLKFYDDITTRNHKKLPKLNLYIAGFPCQSFSSLGKREGFESKNNGNIFFHCYETIKYTQPNIFILENVKGLLTHDNGNTFQTILYYLESLPGYRIYHKIYNTVDYGIPQHRERVYIIGIQSDVPYVHPKKISLKLTVRDILEKNVDDEYYYTLTDHKISILNDLKTYGKIDSYDNDWLANLNVSSYKRSGVKQNIVPCLLAGEGGNCTYFLTSERRKLTEIEYLRLQGFPSTFNICVSRSKTYKQAGNSMSVNVLCFILKNALSCFF